MLQQEHARRAIILHRVLDENTLVFYPLPLLFLKERIEFSKNKVATERNVLRKSMGETKMRWVFFIFTFSLFSYHGN